MTRQLVVEADGGSRGNPGVAGYGALVREASAGERPGRLWAERAAPLGQASNNVAEYSGLIAGLQAVLDVGLAEDAEVEVRMDSKLVVEQMSGRWKIKHQDMRRLALQARDLVRQIEWAGGRVRYVWVPREANQAADALSNDGMDGVTVVRDHPAGGTSTDSLGTASPGTDSPGPAVSAAASPDPASPTFGEGRAPVADMVFSTETTPTLEGTCRLVLVRHGITDFTATHKLDGRGGSNPPLNVTGRRQAEAAAGAVAALLARSEPGDVCVVTSSLTRAVQTGGAVAAALGVEPEVDPDWDEQGFGDWDGRRIEDLVEEMGEELLRLRRDPSYQRPGGESRIVLIERVSVALARAVARGGTVVVATHRMPIMCVLGQVLGIDTDRVWSIATAPASLTAFEFWPDTAVQVAFVNDTHHLLGLD